MSKYCEGCKTYIGEHSVSPLCSYVNSNQNSECPCTSCIIKMVCLKACTDFVNFKISCANLDTFQSGRVLTND